MTSFRMLLRFAENLRKWQAERPRHDCCKSVLVTTSGTEAYTRHDRKKSAHTAVCVIASVCHLKMLALICEMMV
jgi:protein subunit release factor B